MGFEKSLCKPWQYETLSFVWHYRCCPNLKACRNASTQAPVSGQELCKAWTYTADNPEATLWAESPILANPTTWMWMSAMRIWVQEPLQLNNDSIETPVPAWRSGDDPEEIG